MRKAHSDDPQAPGLRKETPADMGASHDANRRLIHAVQRRCVRALVIPFVLRCALQGPVYGWTVRKRLQAFGSPISAGTLYPLLNTLEREGFLQGYITR